MSAIKIIITPGSCSFAKWICVPQKQNENFHLPSPFFNTAGLRMEIYGMGVGSATVSYGWEASESGCCLGTAAW